MSAKPAKRADIGVRLQRLVSLLDDWRCFAHRVLGFRKFVVIAPPYVSPDLTHAECRQIKLHCGGDIFWTGTHSKSAHVTALYAKQTNEKAERRAQQKGNE